MGHFRFSLFGLMAAIALVAIFCAAIAAGTVLWLQMVFICTLVVLLIAVLLACWERGPQRAVYIGFAVFGGIYFLLALAPFFGGNTSALLPSNIMMDLIRSPNDTSPMNRISLGSTVAVPVRYIVHFGAALMFGVIGGLIVDAIYGRTKK
jgi:hypothetical protein